MAYNLGTAHGRIVLTYDGANAVRRAQDDMNGLNDSMNSGNREADRFGKRLSGLFGTMGRITGNIAKWGALVQVLTLSAIAAANLVVQLLSILPALASILSLAATLPVAFVGLIATFAVLKSALKGFGTAVKEAFNTEDPEAFAEALKKLSPEARAAALAFKAMVPQLKALQQELQNEFFEDFRQGLVGMPKAIETLRHGLAGVAQQFGITAKIATQFATTGQGLEFIRRSIFAVNDGMDGLNRSLANVLNGFAAVGVTALNTFPGIHDAVQASSESFGNWMSEISSSGQLAEWLRTAAATLRQLGGILGNVTSIFTSLGNAANAVAGGVLGNLERLTASAAEFLGSAQGMAAVGSIFGGISAVAGGLLPIIQALIVSLAELGPTLGVIATTAGPALLAVAQALGPALAGIAPGLNALAGGLATAFAGLAPALAPLGAAIGEALTALAPLLPVVGSLAAALGPILTAALRALIPLVQPVVAALGALGPIFGQLGPLIATVVTALTPLTSALGGALSTAISSLLTNLAPVAVTLATGLVPAFALLLQMVTPLIDALGPLLNVLVQFVSQALTPLIPVIIQLATILGPLSGVFAALLGPVVALLTPILDLLLIKGLVPVITLLAEALSFILTPLAEGAEQFAKFAAGIDSVNIGPLTDAITNGFNAAWEAVKRFFTDIGGWFSSLGSTIAGWFSDAGSAASTGAGNMVDGVVAWFSALPGRVLGFLQSFPGMVGDFIVNSLHRIAFMIGAAVGLWLSWFLTFPGKAIAALQSFSERSRAFFANAWNNIALAFFNGVNAVISFVLGFPGRVLSAISSLISIVTTVSTAAWNAARNAFTSGVNAVVGFAMSLPGRVRGAISALTSTISSIASTAWNNARSAFSNGVSALADIARSLPGRVREAISGMYNAGRDMIQGFINGARAMAGQAISFVRGLAQDMIDGFKSTFKIGSPSKVMFEAGVDVDKGLINGLKSLAKDVEMTMGAVTAGAMAGVTANVITNPTVLAAPYSPFAGSGPASGGAGGVTINQTVNALPGMDARQVATYTNQRLVLAVRTGANSVLVPEPVLAGV